MEDESIIELFEKRDERAILNASAKYGAYASTVAFNILGNTEDASECLNDALLKTWNSIPPAKPANLKAYIAKIARNLALDRYDWNNAAKRGGGNTDFVFDEISDFLIGAEDVEFSEGEVSKAINNYLAESDSLKRKVFVKRYFDFKSIKDISQELLLSESNVKTMLHRMREGLRIVLEKEGLL